MSRCPRRGRTSYHRTTGRRRCAAVVVGALLCVLALNVLAAPKPGHSAAVSPARAAASGRPPMALGLVPLSHPIEPPTAPFPARPMPVPFASGLGAPTVARAALTPVYQIATTQRVVFLTIDDGITRDPRFLARLLTSHLPVTVFPTSQAVTDQPAFFTPILAAGGSIGDHTVTHPTLSSLSPLRQRNEICAAAAAERRTLGVTPVLFRPPYGDLNQATGAAAASCGMGHELLWNAVITNGVVTNYHGPVTANNPLGPGDIMLMHLRPTFLADFDAALTAARGSHLQIADVTRFLGPTRPSPAEQARQDAALGLYPQFRRSPTGSRAASTLPGMHLDTARGPCCPGSRRVGPA